MSRLVVEASRELPYPVSEVWSLLTDHPRYAEVAPTLSRVEVLSGDRLGMTRRCTDTRGGSWEETCDRWEEGRSFGVEVDTATYPWHLRMAFRRFRGDWSVAPAGPGSVVTVRFAGQLRGGPLGTLLARMFRPKARQLAEAVLDGYQRELDDG